MYHNDCKEKHWFHSTCAYSFNAHKSIKIQLYETLPPVQYNSTIAKKNKNKNMSPYNDSKKHTGIVMNVLKSKTLQVTKIPPLECPQPRFLVR